MTLDRLRGLCRSLPDVAEDLKWGNDLVFTIGGKMFCLVCLDPPHQVSFKTTPERFAELVERPGIIPAPYLARAMWVQETTLGESLERREYEELVRGAYALVKMKAPRRRTSKAAARKTPGGY